MRTSRRISPHVEGIESRALLSVASVVPLIHPPPVLVTGHARGAALIFPNVPDVGTRYVLRGIGNMSPMGRVAVRGTIETTSITGRPTGAVTLANRFGSVELRITGRTSSSDPNTYQFVVSSATGRFANLEGTGGVLEFRATGQAGRGRFAMDINPVIIMSAGK